MTKDQHIQEIYRTGGLVCEYGNGFCCERAKSYIRTAKIVKQLFMFARIISKTSTKWAMIVLFLI